MREESIDILGAGLCGSLLSIMLARHDLAPRLWERQADPRDNRVSGGRSINLALAARGIHALRTAGVFAAVEKLLVPMRGRMIHLPDGSHELQPYGVRENEQIYSVSRAELNRVLLQHAECDHAVEMHFEQTARQFDVDSQVLTLEDKSGRPRNLDGTALIAADGAGSVVRRAYDRHARISPREERLPHGYKELTLPPAANGGYRLDPNALHIWPRGGFMLIGLPNPGGDFTLTLFLPEHGERSFETLQEPATVRAFFESEFVDILPDLDRLEEQFSANPVGVLGTVRCRHWHDRRLLLIGDAAHAIVPFHGQGMNLAFEDCVLLELLLGQHGRDFPAAFSAFEAIQLENASAIADMALDNYVEMRDRVRDPQYKLLKALSFELERRLPERLIPRYSMVMFHPEIPYAVAARRGAQQEALLKELAAGASDITDIDLDAAETVVRNTLDPL